MSDSRCENQIWKSNKLNIFSPSIICHAEVFSKDLPEGGSVTMSVTKTWDLEWGQKTMSKGIVLGKK
jgi:hypothetical protein